MSEVNVRDFEASARAVVDPVFADYFSGGADDEVTLRANERAFAALRLLPRVLRGSAKRELDVAILGCHASMPVVLSPTAFHRLVHDEGERATARAAAGAGTVMIVSMASTVSIGDIATAAAGAKALVVTVDSPVLGNGDRNNRNDFHDLPPGIACENLRNLRGDDSGSVRQIQMSPELSWTHIDWLRGITSLPIVLKGVLHPEDARIAVAHGVDGLLLSNHGGRQLDTVPATIDLLPEHVAAVGGRVPILLDGGVRRGTDIVKALALGATAVGVGRPIVWGLAAGGESGVRRVLELLREELDHTLALCGATSVRDLSPDLVRR
jgi:4-hydroxymandelate oxidase